MTSPKHCEESVLKRRPPHLPKTSHLLLYLPRIFDFSWEVSSLVLPIASNPHPLGGGSWEDNREICGFVDMPQRVGLLTVGESVLDLSDQLHVKVRGWDGFVGLGGWGPGRLASSACPRWYLGFATCVEVVQRVVPGGGVSVVGN